MRHVQRTLQRMVLRVVTHPKTTLLVSALVLAVCVGSAMAWLHISTHPDELFSHNVPFFKRWLDYSQKFPENEALVVVIEAKEGPAPPTQRWIEVADAIADRMRAMGDSVHGVDTHVPLEELGPQGILFQDREQLPGTYADLLQFSPLVEQWTGGGGGSALLGATPLDRLMGALSGSAVTYASPGSNQANAGQTRFVELLLDSWQKTIQKAAAAPGDEKPVSQTSPTFAMKDGAILPDLRQMTPESDPSRSGYYYLPDKSNPARHLLLVQIYPNVNYNSLTAITRVVDGIRREVKAVVEKFPEFTVGVTGRPALAADDMSTTDRDSHRSEIVALSVIFIGMALTLRSIWLALAAELTLAVAIGWTFGWAWVSVGRLNLLSLVFLIALIGIGMDYLVQILMAYRREARRRLRAKAIWSNVFLSVSLPINTACAGAAGAFLVSVFTEFRGAAELGIIAGGGLLLCLLSGYTVLPAMLTLFPPRVQLIDADERYAGPVAHAFGWRKLLPIMWVLPLACLIPFAFKTEFNSNLLELQAPNPSVSLVKKLETWSAVVLCRNLQELRAVQEAMDDKQKLIARTDSILKAYDNFEWIAQQQQLVPKIQWTAPTPIEPAMLPGISLRFRVLGKQYPALKERADATADLLVGTGESGPKATAVAEGLTKWEAGFAEELGQIMARLSPPAPDPDTLPKSIHNHYISASSTREYALYIYPVHDLWKREHLMAFEQEVERRVAAVNAKLHTDLQVTGIASDVYGTTSSIEKSFYRTTAMALVLIFLLVFIDLRSFSHTVLAVSVLALGLPMLVALMGLFHYNWNFANFFGLPILIGAGHEYGVFMVHRYREARNNPRRAWRKWDHSDRALLLCAFVTSSSFGFFWAMGHHRGLRSLGLVMALGTACIYLATILVLRPLLLRRLERRGDIPLRHRFGDSPKSGSEKLKTEPRDAGVHI